VLIFEDIIKNQNQIYRLQYTMASLWDIGVAAIVARECFEGALIIGQYRSLIRKSDLKLEEKSTKYKVVNKAAIFASLFAIVVCACVGFGLAIAGKDLDKATAEIIEGVSKIVAGLCIGQLSLKIPKWMGLYGNKKNKDASVLADGSLYFNVSWNLFREIGEIGVFLIPFFLSGRLLAIGVSSIAGVVIALVLGLLLEILNRTMDTKSLGIFSTILVAWLAVGLFTGGWHELEEVFGETPYVYEIPGSFWNHKKFPMVLFKPFGYSYHPTVLMVSVFWGYAISLTILHYVKFVNGKKNNKDDASPSSAAVVDENKSISADGQELRSTGARTSTGGNYHQANSPPNALEVV
jgi:high-affinity iron transporter